MREIVLDTETTGMDPGDGHRVIEIGCVELVNHVPTGNHYHVYINPERDVPPDAVAVHGITDAFLQDKPVFGEIIASYLDFIGDARLVIHNAEFDIKFLNAEMKTLGFPTTRLKDVTDTLQMAREKFPGSPANLDALCRRFGIDNATRELHGALLDAQLLAEVYLELMGGRQHGLTLQDQGGSAGTGGGSAGTGSGQGVPGRKQRPYREPRNFPVSEEELAAHEELVSQLKDPLWAGG